MQNRDSSSRPDSEPASLWTARDARESYPRLQTDRETDVAIIGGGIVGLTAALLLQDAGLDVTVIEARRVGRQVTSRSTAKVTSQHGLKYHRLSTTYGIEAARLYAQANEGALHFIGERAADLAPGSRFERRTAYTYTTNRGSLDALHEEVEAAVQVGLPARFTSEVGLPFPVAGAVAFDGQAQFDPYAYLEGLATRVAERGAVFEETRVHQVDEGEPCRLSAHEHSITARKVIVATHLPFLDRGLYYARTKPEAHCVIAALLDGPPLDGMFISTDSPTRSLRSFEDERGAWLVLSGEAYTPGDGDTDAMFAALEAEARERFPVASVEYRWTNEDYNSVDELPLVGPLLPTSDHISVATGFGAWGITNGTVAAQILADAILDRPSAIGELFSTKRFTPKESAGATLSEVAETAKSYVDRVLPTTSLDLAAIAPGQRAVGEFRGERTAISRDEDGTLHAVSAICSHMGCIVGWNASMRTWDCPCHGSTFSADGAVLHGPAVHDLERVELNGPEGA